MGITKTLKTKLAQQQGYQPLDNASQQEVQPQQPQRRVSLQATTLAEKHQMGILKGAFMVFLLGLVFVRLAATSLSSCPSSCLWVSPMAHPVTAVVEPGQHYRQRADAGVAQRDR